MLTTIDSLLVHQIIEKCSIYLWRIGGKVRRVKHKPRSVTSCWEIVTRTARIEHSVSQNNEKIVRRFPRKLETTHAAQNYVGRKKIWVLDVNIRKLSIAMGNIRVHAVSKSWTHKDIQGVPGGMDKTSGACFLCWIIPI